MSYKSAALSGKIEELKAAGCAPLLVSWEKHGMILGGAKGGRRYAYFIDEQTKFTKERWQFLKLLKPRGQDPKIIFSNYRKKDKG